MTVQRPALEARRTALVLSGPAEPEGDLRAEQGLNLGGRFLGGELDPEEEGPRDHVLALELRQDGLVGAELRVDRKDAVRLIESHLCHVDAPPSRGSFRKSDILPFGSRECHRPRQSCARGASPASLKACTPCRIAAPRPMIVITAREGARRGADEASHQGRAGPPARRTRASGWRKEVPPRTRRSTAKERGTPPLGSPAGIVTE